MTLSENNPRIAALEAALELVTSGRMTANIGISTVTDAAGQFLTFLETDPTAKPGPAKAPAASATPSPSSTTPASPPHPSTTSPAAPDF